MGPGWGQAGDTNVGSTGLLGAASIGSLREHGFHVLTWDPRGFGESDGTAEVNSPDAEARDVRRCSTGWPPSPSSSSTARATPARA